MTIRPPGMRIGLPAISPWSLPEAMSDPVNVMLPMITSRTVGTLISSGIALPAAKVWTLARRR